MGAGSRDGKVALVTVSSRGLGKEVQRWSDTLQTVDARLVPDWQKVREALLRCAPTPLEPRVVHGDFRLGNVLAAGSRVNAVIDWEIWSLGDPRIDGGWFLINCDPYTYRRVDAPDGRVPPIDEVAELYESELGREITALAWRRRAPSAEVEAMAETLPGLLEQARSSLA